MKFLSIIVSLAVLWLATQIPEKESEWATGSFKGEPAQAAALPAKPTFTRGVTELQKQPCRPDFNRDHYRSEIVSADELNHYLTKTPFSPEQRKIMVAIAMAESGNQINCHGDDYKPYYMQKAPNGETWYVSIGLYQIRTIVEQKGSGSCRDYDRLQNNIEAQTQCAYEIWSQRKSFTPWTTYTKGKYRKYL